MCSYKTSCSVDQFRSTCIEFGSCFCCGCCNVGMMHVRDVNTNRENVINLESIKSQFVQSVL